jgi:hypothetical protein
MAALLSSREQNLQLLDDAEVYTVKFCVIFGTIITLIRAFIFDGIREFMRAVRRERRKGEDIDQA